MKKFTAFLFLLFWCIGSHAQTRVDLAMKEYLEKYYSFDYSPFVCPGNQPKFISMARPQVFLVKIVSIKRWFSSTFFEVVIPGVDHGVYVYPYETVFDSDVPEGYKDIVDGEYYLMALVNPYCDEKILKSESEDDTSFSWNPIFRPKHFIATNMINGKIRPIKPSDLKRFKRKGKYKSPWNGPINPPMPKMLF